MVRANPSYWPKASGMDQKTKHLLADLLLSYKVTFLCEQLL